MTCSLCHLPIAGEYAVLWDTDDVWPVCLSCLGHPTPTGAAVTPVSIDELHRMHRWARTKARGREPRRVA